MPFGLQGARTRNFPAYDGHPTGGRWGLHCRLPRQCCDTQQQLGGPRTTRPGSTPKVGQCWPHS